MSDLGAILHVKKDGTQYDAHAYTTEDECPSPNLKIKTKDGTQAYVKLTDNGSGDVPLRVKPKSSTTYQVIASAVPTGQWQLAGTYKILPLSSYSENGIYYSDTNLSTVTFTVPAGVKVLKVGIGGTISYVGVTPQKKYNLYLSLKNATGMYKAVSHVYSKYEETYTHNGTTYAYKYVSYAYTSGVYSPVTFSWSPEINKQTPTVTDY